MNEAAPLAPTRHRIDAATWLRMGEAGIFAKQDRIELIDGELIDMAPISDDHIDAVNLLNERLVVAALGKATVSVQNPVTVDRFNMPQPDFALFRGRPNRIGDPAARALASVILVVEVADTSLQYDRSTKLRLYAEAGIPEYWIVDLPNRVLTIHRRPSGGHYLDLSEQRDGGRVALAAAPDIVVDLDRILG